MKNLVHFAYIADDGQFMLVLENGSIINANATNKLYKESKIFENNSISGFVCSGTFLNLDNIKATVTDSENRGLSIALVQGPDSFYVTGVKHTESDKSVNTKFYTFTKTPSSSLFDYNFTSIGDWSQYQLTDFVNNKAYRITLVIGDDYNNNFICMERLM